MPRGENRSFVCGRAMVQEEGPISGIPANIGAVMSKEFEIPSDVRGTVGRNIARYE